MAYVVQEVVIDCREPGELAQFWARLLDAQVGLPDPEWAVVAADPLLIAFQQVPEPKSSPKNRLHLDIRVEDVAAAISRAERLGARVIRPFTAEGDSGFAVLADLEDNEFCFVTDPTGSWESYLRDSLRDPD